MKFRLLVAVSMLFFVVSCGSKKKVTPEGGIPEMRYSKLIKEYKSHSFKESTIETIKIKAKVSYKIGHSSQKLGLNVRIAKGEKIWLSADFLGIPVVKMLIEPDSIHYYNKIDKTYFAGSFEFVNGLAGLNLSYPMLENLLVGDFIFNTKNKDFDVDINKNSYFIFNNRNKDVFKEAAIYPLTYKLKSQVIEDVVERKKFAAHYNTYSSIGGFLFPKDLVVKTKNKGKASVITLKYEKVLFDKKLNFPYKVPKDCDKAVVLKHKK